MLHVSRFLFTWSDRMDFLILSTTSRRDRWSCSNFQTVTCLLVATAWLPMITLIRILLSRSLVNPLLSSCLPRLTAYQVANPNHATSQFSYEVRTNSGPNVGSDHYRGFHHEKSLRNVGGNPWNTRAGAFDFHRNQQGNGLLFNVTRDAVTTTRYGQFSCHFCIRFTDVGKTGFADAPTRIISYVIL